MSIEGPNVWASVKVPSGVHRLSFYFFNKDGHHGSNRLRDYLLELKPPCQTVEEAEKSPALARARVRDFWGGVYKQFIVTGPGQFWLKVGRNNSFNTILYGVFADKISGPETVYEFRRDVWLGDVRYELNALQSSNNDSSDAANPLAPSVEAARKAMQARLVCSGKDGCYVFVPCQVQVEAIFRHLCICGLRRDSAFASNASIVAVANGVVE